MATLKIKSGIHFVKKQPAESHVLVSAAPSGDAAEYVYTNDTAIPTAGDFDAAALFSDTSGNATTGCWSLVPDGSVAYSNGVSSCVWAGEEARCAAFFLGTSTGLTSSFSYNYTEAVNDTLTTAGHIATLYRSSNIVYIYLGSIRPLQGIKMYIGTANAAAASTAVNYWNGTAWTAVSGLADGTAVAGATFAQTGSLTFTSTTTTAKTRSFGGATLYFYQIVITGFSGDTVTVSRCTLDMPMQTVKDIWDGRLRPLGHAEIRILSSDEPSRYGDLTMALSSVNEVYGDLGTYHPFDTNDQITLKGLYLGFFERMQGIFCKLRTGDEAHTGTITVKYWNGSAWTAVSGQVDNTTPGFTRTGWITWTAPTLGTEHTRSLSGELPLYYYQITFSGTFDSRLDYVGGMPVEQTLDQYAIPAQWQNRFVLLSSVDERKSSMRISSYGTTCVFNGDDSLYIESVGDDSPIVAAGSLFSRDTNGFYDTLVICKNRETWILDGTTVNNYRLYKVSDLYGCVAPQTFRTLQLGLAEGNSRHVAIWQSASGVVVFDGNSIIDISADIKNYFDKENTTEAIIATNIAKGSAFVDEKEQEYHWLFASGSSSTGIDTELVYSFTRKAWFKIDRTPVLLCGIPVVSTLGDVYVYGGTATGYLERLEYESTDTFDGTAITHTIVTRDIPMKDWNTQTLVRRVKLVTKANSGVSATISHYADGNLSADSATQTVSPTDALKRIVQGKNSVNWGHNVFHGFQVVVVGNSGTTLLEPIALVGYYQEVRPDNV